MFLNIDRSNAIVTIIIIKKIGIMIFPFPPYPNFPSNATCSKAKKHLLHVGTSRIRLRRHRLALDALSAWVVSAGVLADIGRAGVRSDGSLTGAVALSMAGGVVGAETLLLGLLLLELLAGTGAAAKNGVSGTVVVDGCWGIGLRTESW
jgi:hypothetical protein